MLLQTNSYIVPKEKRAEHARLMRRFRQVLNALGCDDFEIYEQVGANWSNGETSGRFVQIMRFRDRKHQLAVQGAERTDPTAQQLISEFCALVNYPYQQQQGHFAVGFYASILPVAPRRAPEADNAAEAGEFLQANESFPTETATSPQDPHAESLVEVGLDDAPTQEAQVEPPMASVEAGHNEDHPDLASSNEPGEETHPPLSMDSPADIQQEDPLDEEPFHAADQPEGDNLSVDDFTPDLSTEELSPLEEPEATSHQAASPAHSSLNPAEEHAQDDDDDLVDLDVLDGDLELDDDLSRLANELAARETQGDAAHNAHNGQRPGGSASENGAH